jgi:hypothetical protein
VHGEVVQVFDNLRPAARVGVSTSARRPARLVHQLMEDLEEKRRRLSAAGHRTGEQVLAGERQRDASAWIGVGRGRDPSAPATGWGEVRDA